MRNHSGLCTFNGLQAQGTIETEELRMLKWKADGDIGEAMERRKGRAPSSILRVYN